METVLCIGAHPDDVELGMGATIVAMVKAGARVVIVDLTDGEPTPHGDHETRMREAGEAAKQLGVAARHTLPFPNRHLADAPEPRRAVAELIRQYRPTRVFLPSPIDAHPDHVAAAAIGLAARFHAKLVKTDMTGDPWYPKLVFEYPAVHARFTVRPSFVVDISETLEQKLAALRCYQSQFVANSANHAMVAWIETQARYWGGMIRCQAGEPFFATEELRVSSILSLG
jgi:bacillithiol biosynthesis deacetylase BshB1